MGEPVTVGTIVLAVMFVQASIWIASASIVRAIERSAVGAVGLRAMTERKEGE